MKYRASLLALISLMMLLGTTLLQARTTMDKTTQAIILSQAGQQNSENRAGHYQALAATTEDKQTKLMYMMMAANSQAQAQAASRAKKQNEDNKKKNDDKSADDKNKNSVPMPTEMKSTFEVPKAPEENLEIAGKIDLTKPPQTVRASVAAFGADAPIMDLASLSTFSLGGLGKAAGGSAGAEAAALEKPKAVTTLSPIEQKDLSYKAPEDVSGVGKPAPIIGALQGSPSIKPQDNPADLWKPDHKDSGSARRVKQEEPGEDRSIASEPEGQSKGGSSDANALFESIFAQMNGGMDDGISIGEDMVERDAKAEPVPTLFEMASVRFQYAARFERRLKTKAPIQKEQSPQIAIR